MAVVAQLTRCLTPVDHVSVFPTLVFLSGPQDDNSAMVACS